MMFLNLRFGIDAAAGVIEIDVLAAIKARVIFFAKCVYGFSFFVSGISFEESFKFTCGHGRSPIRPSTALLEEHSSLRSGRISTLSLDYSTFQVLQFPHPPH